jgi:hypothetical protein
MRSDRDPLIRRLEEETANSAVLLGRFSSGSRAPALTIAPDGDKGC